MTTASKTLFRLLNGFITAMCGYGESFCIRQEQISLRIMQHTSTLSGLKRVRATRDAASFRGEVKYFFRLKNALCLSPPRNLSVADNTNENRRTGHDNTWNPRSHTGLRKYLHQPNIVRTRSPTGPRPVSSQGNSACGRGPWVVLRVHFLPRALRFGRRKFRDQSISDPQAKRMLMKMLSRRNKARFTGKDQFEVAMLSSRQGRSRGPAIKLVHVVVVDVHGIEASANIEPADKGLHNNVLVIPEMLNFLSWCRSNVVRCAFRHYANVLLT